jgi:hypothetical protein
MSKPKTTSTALIYVVLFIFLLLFMLISPKGLGVCKFEVEPQISTHPTTPGGVVTLLQ